MNDTSDVLKQAAEKMRKAAAELRDARIEKKAAVELDPKRVLDFLRFFGGRHD